MEHPSSPTQHSAPINKMTGRTKLALLLLIGPSALWVIVFILFAVTNFVFTSTLSDIGVDAGTSVINTIVNVILYLVGVVAFITWLPGIITGIILLATKPQAPVAAPQPPTEPKQ
jgi:hypothetical protein